MPLGYFSDIRGSFYLLYLRLRGQRSKVVSFYLFALSHVEDFLWTAAQTQADVVSRWGHSLLSLVIISRWSRLAPPTPGTALKSGQIICSFLSGLLCGSVICDECNRSRVKPPPVRSSKSKDQFSSTRLHHCPSATPSPAERRHRWDGSPFLPTNGNTLAANVWTFYSTLYFGGAEPLLVSRERAGSGRGELNLHLWGAWRSHLWNIFLSFRHDLKYSIHLLL